MDTKPLNAGWLEFLKATVAEWKILLTGFVPLAVVGLLEALGYPLPPALKPWAYGLFIFLIILLGSYRAWKHERLDLNYAMDRLRPRVNIVFDDRAPFVELNPTGKAGYRVLRVRVDNIGGVDLYSLTAQLEFFDQFKSFDAIDLVLMNQDLPIIKGQVYRPAQLPRNTFNLLRGQSQYVVLVMQDLSRMPCAELALTKIRNANYSNVLNTGMDYEFTVLVIGTGMAPVRKKFKLSFGKNHEARLAEVI